MEFSMPYFRSDSDVLNRAARIAASDLAGNCLPYRDGLLPEKRTCIMAGLDYDTPWTRDTAINSMNYFSIAAPEIAKNTLLSVLEKKNGELRIGGQYWDAIIWVPAAWRHWLINRDREFLAFSFDVAAASLARFEEEEFDAGVGLFRGPAVYGDGIAAYPDRYIDRKNHYPDIVAFAEYRPDLKAKKGFGMPMFALSTNCIYYEAYRAFEKTGRILGRDTGRCAGKAEALKAAIDRRFWNERTGLYNYLYDDFGGCDREEALGLSFAILSGIADEEKRRSVVRNKHLTGQGVACLWPSYERYRIGNHYGRHSGTVWPHAQGFWALAMLRSGEAAKFEYELNAMAYKAVRDLHFAELYHPDTGEIYGGMQENQSKGITLWRSCVKQTWSASAFWSLLLYGIAGLSYTEEGAVLTPTLPEGLSYAELDGIPLFGSRIDIVIRRDGVGPGSIRIDAGEAENTTYELSV